MPRSDKDVHARLDAHQGVHARLDATSELICVDPARIREFWTHALPLIAAAMKRGGITDLADVERAVLAGHALVWIAWNGAAIKAAAVTQLSTVNGERMCTIVACGGSNGKEWLPLLAGLERYAKAEDCKAMRIFGRRGWERLLPDYKPARILLEKELT
jgi:hypothetical protein